MSQEIEDLKEEIDTLKDRIEALENRTIEEVKCKSCDGTGYEDDFYCQHEASKCRDCKGRGHVFQLSSLEEK